MKQYRVLIVDDEVRILNFLSSKLKLSDYEVFTAPNGYKALEQIQLQEPDIVILDILMPRMDGFETLKEIRGISSVPVIILSARGSYADKVKGLKLGADDYLSKPFNPDELVARIEAVRRRMVSQQDRRLPEELRLGDVTMDFKKRTVAVRGQEVRLTRIEWLLLSELAQNVGRLMLYEELLTRVWGPEYRNDVQILRTWMSRLRYKIEKNPRKPSLIKTISKTGYIVDQPSAA